MQCVVLTCNQNDSSRIAPQETRYFKFPLDPSLRAAWLESLQKTDWQPEEDSVVCSKHFLPEDIVEDSNGLQTLRENATPVFTVQACRICFATCCKLYPLTTYKILNMAYKTLTGLSIQRDQIPPYLCNGCAHRLLECARFRTKSLEAHSVLLDIATKNNYITLESIQSFHNIQNPITSNEAPEHSEQYDIDTEVAEMEIINATEQTGTTQEHVLFEEITIDCVKLETDDNNEEIDSYKSLTNNAMVHIASEPSLPDDISVDDFKAKDTDVMSSDINDESKNNDLANDMEGEQDNQGDAMDDPQLEDDTQNEQSKTKDDIPQLEDGSQNDEQINTKEQEDTMDDEVEVYMVVEEEDSTMEDSYEKPENENTSLIYDETPSESLVLDEEDANAKQGAQEEQDVKNIPEQLNKVADTARNPQVEGEESSDDNPLGEVSEKPEASPKAVQEVRIVLEKLKYSNVEIHGGLDGISNQVLSCGKCPFQTINKMQMTSHLKAHAASKSYNCSMCNYKTIHKRSLAWHATVHSKEKPHSCDTCDKKFRHKGSLLVHMRQHTGKKPYSCSICKKKFSEITNLRRHVIIHTGEKPYLCDVCNKAFRQIGHLKKHIRMHAGEKPYVCDYCEKACSQKAHLIKHMRIHIDNLRYACKICNKIFRHDVTLENHMRKHSSKKTYSCEVCKNVYSQRSRLRIHMKKHMLL